MNQAEKKDGYLRRKYALSLSEHVQMYANQNGCCAICREPLPYDRVHTDHDHNTGKVRGLLCTGCNTAIAIFDNYGKLTRAIDYLSLTESPVERVRRNLLTRVPVEAFVEECCVLNIGRVVLKDDMFSVWCRWCEEQGYDPGVKDGFSRRLFKAYEGVAGVQLRVARLRVNCGPSDRAHFYRGIALKEETRQRYLTAIA